MVRSLPLGGSQRKFAYAFSLVFPSIVDKWDIEVPSLVDGKRRNIALVSDFVSWDAESQDTKSLTSARFLLFPSTSDRTCFSHDKKEKFTRFTVKLAS